MRSENWEVRIEIIRPPGLNSQFKLLVIREIRGEIPRESINELAHSRINEFREFFSQRPFNPVSLQHPSTIVLRHTYGKGFYKEAVTFLYWRALLPCSPRLERVKTYCQRQPFFTFMRLIFGKTGDEYVIFAARRGGVWRKNVVSNWLVLNV